MTIRATARRLTGAAALLATALALTACTAPAADTSPGSAPPAPEQPGLSGELNIYAAASLKAAFDDIATAFEEENPGVTVNPIIYDGSSTLVTQLAEGAPGDVFASADQANMTKAVDAGLLADGDPTLFATNTLVIAMPTGNPAGITALADLARADVALVLCAPEVPCGAASQKLFAAQGVTVAPVSLEQNVTAVLTKVAAGEADAGLVYRTDVQGRTDVTAIVPEGAADVVNRYPIGALTASANPDAAAAFVAFVAGTHGREILAGYGFGAP